MTDRSLTDNEIKLRFDFQDATLQRIEKLVQETKEQATKTNGTVALIKEWKSFMQGAVWAFAGIFTLVIVPLLSYALYEIAHIDATVRQDVHEELINQAT